VQFSAIISSDFNQNNNTSATVFVKPTNIMKFDNNPFRGYRSVTRIQTENYDEARRRICEPSLRKGQTVMRHARINLILRQFRETIFAAEKQ